MSNYIYIIGEDHFNDDDKKNKEIIISNGKNEIYNALLFLEGLDISKALGINCFVLGLDDQLLNLHMDLFFFKYAISVENKAYAHSCIKEDIKKIEMYCVKSPLVVKVLALYNLYTNGRTVPINDTDAFRFYKYLSSHIKKDPFFAEMHACLSLNVELISTYQNLSEVEQCNISTSVKKDLKDYSFARRIYEYRDALDNKDIIAIVGIAHADGLVTHLKKIGITDEQMKYCSSQEFLNGYPEYSSDDSDDLEVGPSALRR